VSKPGRAAAVTSTTPARWDGDFRAAYDALAGTEEELLQRAGDVVAARTLSDAQVGFCREMANLAECSPDPQRRRQALDWLEHVASCLLALGPAGDDEVVYHLQVFRALSQPGDRTRKVSAILPTAYVKKLAEIGDERSAPAPQVAFTVDSIESIRDARRRLEQLGTELATRGRLPRKRRDNRVVRHTYWMWLHAEKELTYKQVIDHWRKLTASWEALLPPTDRADLGRLMASQPKHQQHLFLEWYRLSRVEEKMDSEPSIAKAIRELRPVARASVAG
jgi:hypothetical protein